MILCCRLLWICRSSPPAASKSAPCLFRLFARNYSQMLELDVISDRLIGSDEEGGLSLEQRKRTTLGVELAANPSIIFLGAGSSGGIVFCYALTHPTSRGTGGNRKESRCHQSCQRWSYRSRLLRAEGVFEGAFALSRTEKLCGRKNHTLAWSCFTYHPPPRVALRCVPSDEPTSGLDARSAQVRNGGMGCVRLVFRAVCCFC